MSFSDLCSFIRQVCAEDLKTAVSRALGCHLNFGLIQASRCPRLSCTKLVSQIVVQKSQGFSLRRPQTNRNCAILRLNWETDFYTPEVLPFCRFQRQRCIKILCPKDPDFYTPLALKRAKGQHLPALEVHKKQSPNLPLYPKLLPN